jgi:ankyrin repeat protein
MIVVGGVLILLLIGVVTIKVILPIISTSVEQAANTKIVPQVIIEPQVIVKPHVIVDQAADDTTIPVDATTLSSYQSNFEDIFQAAGNGTMDDIRYFLDRGDSIHAKKAGVTLLHCAAADNSNVDVVKYLVSLGLDVNTSEDGGLHETPLHAAAKWNPNLDILEYLISQNADVHARRGDDATPLHLFAEGNNPNLDVLKRLLSHGANINAMGGF